MQLFYHFKNEISTKYKFYLKCCHQRSPKLKFNIFKTPRILFSIYNDGVKLALAMQLTFFTE